jgi:hypothetical protein
MGCGCIIFACLIFVEKQTTLEFIQMARFSENGNEHLDFAKSWEYYDRLSD